MVKADIEIDKRQLEQVQRRLKAMGADAGPAIVDSVRDIANEVANKAKANHVFVGTGKGSSAKAIGAEYVFLNPDGSPRFRVRTNNLIRSIKPMEPKIRGGVVEAKVVADQEYARQVEEGGAGRRAFPFMRPAVEATRPQALKILRARVAEHIRREHGTGF